MIERFAQIEPCRRAFRLQLDGAAQLINAFAPHAPPGQHNAEIEQRFDIGGIGTEHPLQIALGSRVAQRCAEHRGAIQQQPGVVRLGFQGAIELDEGPIPVPARIQDQAPAVRGQRASQGQPEPAQAPLPSKNEERKHNRAPDQHAIRAPEARRRATRR